MVVGSGETGVDSSCVGERRSDVRPNRFFERSWRSHARREALELNSTRHESGWREGTDMGLARFPSGSNSTGFERLPCWDGVETPGETPGGEAGAEGMADTAAAVAAGATASASVGAAPRSDALAEICSSSRARIAAA